MANSLEALAVKQLHKDPDALVLFVVALLYVLLPHDLFAQVKDRLNDPLVVTLVGAMGGGRFWLRGKAAAAKGVALAAEAEAKS